MCIAIIYFQDYMTKNVRRKINIVGTKRVLDEIESMVKTNFILRCGSDSKLTKPTVEIISVNFCSLVISDQRVIQIGILVA